MIPVPPIGWRIHFFENGDRTSPLVADVTEVGIGPKGAGPILSLNFQYPGGMLRGKYGVHHADDPWFKGDLKLLQKYGSWDYIPGFLPPVVEVKAEKKAVPDRREEGLAKAREYANQGLPIDEIAPKVRSFGLKKEDVEELLTQPV